MNRKTGPYNYGFKITVEGNLSLNLHWAQCALTHLPFYNLILLINRYFFLSQKKTSLETSSLKSKYVFQSEV